MTDKEVNKKTCNVPGCGKDTFCRGLCATHYWRMKKGRNAAVRAEAEKYAEASKRPGKRKSATRQPKPVSKPDERTAPAEGGTNVPPGKQYWGSDEFRERLAEERIAAVTEFATAVGIRSIDYEGGLLFLSPGEDRQPLYLTPAGTLRHVKLTVSDNTE